MSATKKYNITFYTFCFLCILLVLGLMVYKNPVPPDSPSFIPVVKRRFVSVLAMFIAAICQSLATISFQTVSFNRIITPSLLGFEALYSLIHTSTIFFFGSTVLISFTGVGPFLLQVGMMVIMCILLYSWLLTGRRANMDLMLLVGMVFGVGLRSLSTFMRRLLTPSEFDILQAKLFGSVNNADEELFPIALLIILFATVILFLYSNKLDVMALGRDISVNLGLNYQREVIIVLIVIAILMAVSTALVGPMNFFGFLVATLTYRIVPNYHHKYVFRMGIVLGFTIIAGAYFLMYNFVETQGVVSIIIELLGGSVFLISLIVRRREYD